MRNNTISLGRLFVTTILQSAGAPLVDPCITYEHCAFGRCGDGFVVRPPFIRHRPVKALVVGWWRKPSDDSDGTGGQLVGMSA